MGHIFAPVRRGFAIAPFLIIWAASSPAAALGDGKETRSGSRAAPPPAFGASITQIEARCKKDSGSWERSPGDSWTCRGAHRDWSAAVDVRTWFDGEVASGETSFGPAESFEQAKVRAARLASVSWGKLETSSWGYDCGGQDLRAREVAAHARQCRWSWRWLTAERRTHLLVTPRSGGTWQVVFDDSRMRPAGRAPGGRYPVAVGRFRFGESPADDERACVAAKGRFVHHGTDSPRCDEVDVPEVGIVGAWVILHHECDADSLCRLIVGREASSERDAVERYLKSRKEMAARFGPPDDVRGEPCDAYGVEHLIDSLHDGHCEIGANWEKEGANFGPAIRPADRLSAHPAPYPITRWTVSVSFATPEHDDMEMRPMNCVPR